MLGPDAPLGWSLYLQKYVRRDRPAMSSESDESDSMPTGSVMLKLLDFPGHGDKHYYVCPGQSISQRKW